VIRAVIDTNVVVSGILNRAGVPAAVLKAAGLRYELWCGRRPSPWSVVASSTCRAS
jgi:hypothetical protein